MIREQVGLSLTGMSQPRKSSDVVQQLLNSMTERVTRYHTAVVPISNSANDLIPRTAFFPGGCGLWRGENAFGEMPSTFPANSIIVVGHNFDILTAFERTKARGGEANGPFWQNLLGMLNTAGLKPEECFYTNALMGLKNDGSSTGPMPRVPGYIDQCKGFLKDQVAIVQPRALLALGDNAGVYVPLMGKAWTKVRHPSNWAFRPAITKRTELEKDGSRIRAFLQSIG